VARRAPRGGGGVSEAERAAAALVRARSAYEAVLRDAERLAAGGEPEAALGRVAAAARIGCFAHTGRYSDPRAERLAVAIGRAELPGTATRRARAPRDRRRIVHVATRVLASGGHTRLLVNWMENDTGSSHDLVLTGQPVGTVPDFVAETVQRLGGRIRSLPYGTPSIERARQLRDVAGAEADLIVLHVHQFDVVPLVAFAAPGGPPVLYVNHADHMFWLGATIADVVLNIRPFAHRITEARRGARRSVLFGIPLREPAAVPDRQQARIRLEIPPGTLALVTMGAAYKFRPTATHDFFATQAEVLRRVPDARLFAIGLTLEQARALLPAGFPIERLVCTGVLPDPSLHLAAADLFVECFPYNSFTSLLDAAALGAPPVLMYAPSPQLRLHDDPGLAATRETHTSEEYVEYVVGLLHDPEARRELAARARRDTLATHMGASWAARMEQLYAEATADGHVVTELPDVPAAADEEDLARARWDELALGAVPLMAVGARLSPSWRDFGALFARSIRTGDTRLRLRHLRAWLWTARMRARGPLE
jgi:hypothetical protein